MRELSLPEKLVADVNRRYPKVWRQLDEARARKDSWDWPLEVFFPMSILVEMGGDICGSQQLSLQQFVDLNKISAAAAWRPAQDMVRFDPQVYESVLSTPLSGNFPVNVLWRLPAWAIYMESPGLRLMDAEWDGFISRLDVSSDGTRRLRMYFLSGAKEMELALPVGDWSIEHALDETLRETRTFLGAHGINIPSMTESNVLHGVKSAINLVLYVCSYGLNDTLWQPGWRASYPSAKKIKGGWRLFPPDRPRLHLLGGEIGERMRALNPVVSHGGSHASPRPHLRRAHWHGYWTGPRKEEAKRQFATRWLPPIPVAMGMDEELTA